MNLHFCAAASFLLATFLVPFVLADSLPSPVSAQVEFAGPKEIKVGTNFVARCQVALSTATPHNVTFYLNNQPIGHYVVQANGRFSWQTLLFFPDLNVFPGPKDTPYSAIFEPLSYAAQGAYKCSVTIDVPGEDLTRARYFSKQWDGLDVSGKKFTPPTATLAFRNTPTVSALSVGEPFVGKCSLDLSLKDTNYKVKFIVDRWARAQYVVNGKLPTPTVHYQLLLPSPTLNIFRGNDTTYPDFTVQYVPIAPVQGNTRFRCDVELEIPNGGGQAQFYSNSVCTTANEQQCNSL